LKEPQRKKRPNIFSMNFQPAAKWSRNYRWCSGGIIMAAAGINSEFSGCLTALKSNNWFALVRFKITTHEKQFISLSLIWWECKRISGILLLCVQRFWNKVRQSACRNFWIIGAEIHVAQRWTWIQDQSFDLIRHYLWKYWGAWYCLGGAWPSEIQKFNGCLTQNEKVRDCQVARSFPMK